MIIKKTEIKIILLYIFLFSIVYQSGSTRAAVVSTGLLFYVTRTLMLVVPVLLFLSYGSLNKYHLNYVICAILCGSIISGLTMIQYPEGVFLIVYKVIVFIEASVVIMLVKDWKIDIYMCIYKLLLCIAFVTLLFYIPIELFKIPIPYTYIYGEAYDYRNYLELFQTYHFKLALPRLSGLFWEPGMYQIYLNCTLMLYALLRRESKKELAVIMINILFAQSTSGYCVATIILAYIISNSRKINKSSRKIMYSVGLGLVLIAVGIFVLIKKRETNIVGDSYYMRVLDLINCLKVFASSPVIGVGFGNETPFKMLDIYGRGSSNGFLSYMYMTGLLGLVIFLLPFIKSIVQNKGNNRVVMSIWFAVVLIENNTEPIYNLPLMAFILALQYTSFYKRGEVNVLHRESIKPYKNSISL